MLGIFKHILFLGILSLFLTYILNKRNHARRKLLSNFYKLFAKNFIDLLIIFLPFMLLDFVFRYWYLYKSSAASETSTTPQIANILIVIVAYLAGQYHVLHNDEAPNGLKYRLNNIKASFTQSAQYYLRYLFLILIVLFFFFAIIFGLYAFLTAFQIIGTINESGSWQNTIKIIAALIAFIGFSLIATFYFGKYALAPTTSIAKQLNIKASLKLVSQSLNFKSIIIIVVDVLFLVLLPLLILFILAGVVTYLLPVSTIYDALALILSSLVSGIYFAWLVCWQTVLTEKYILK